MWLNFEIGGIDVRWAGTGSPYLVDSSSSDPDPTRNEQFVPLRASSGARLASSIEAEVPVALNIFCMGDTLAEAKANRAALNSVLVAARNARSTGALVSYSFQEDPSEEEPETWRIIGGKVRPVRSFNGGSPVIGVNGKPCALAMLSLVLSKG